MTISRPVEHTALAQVEHIRQVKLQHLQNAIAAALDKAKTQKPQTRRHEVQVDYDPDQIRLVEISEVLSRFGSQHAVNWRAEKKTIKIIFR